MGGSLPIVASRQGPSLHSPLRCSKHDVLSACSRRRSLCSAFQRASTAGQMLHTMFFVGITAASSPDPHTTTPSWALE
ncbi:hypothetical protein IG631_07404 [Alternaria alternata]|nr:hypothetical protein IG631_07404 [Alternaria alternata]